MSAEPGSDREPTKSTVSTVGVQGMLASLEPALLSAVPPPPANIREYRLISRLGEGGMGAVYKAEHTRLGRLVAIKLLSAYRTQSASAIARFDREMLAVGALDHANIVRAFDAGEHEGRHYLVMEYVAGLDMSELLRRHGRLPVAEACEIVRQAALGLQHAHEAGLVHRDIKPSNLMLTPGGVVKILDLGLALFAQRENDELTSTGQVLGTVDYMAPEQGDDTHRVDIRSDIYSLGATLYKLLTGEVPFGGSRYDTNVKKLKALGVVDPEPVQSRRPEVPAELSQLVSRLLARSPDARPATPAEVVQLLQPFCSGADLPALAARLADMPREAAREETSVSDSSSAKTAPTEVKPQVEKAAPERKSPVNSPRRWILAGSVALVTVILAAVGYYVASGPRSDIHRSSVEQIKADQQAWASRLRLPVEYTDKFLGTKLLLIPAGEFEMGMASEEIDDLMAKEGDAAMQECVRSSGPIHKVVLKRPFYLGLHEVTQEEYQKVMGENPSYFNAERVNDAAHCPVDQVRWGEAADFCNKLSERNGLKPRYIPNGQDWNLVAGNGFRLPTEAEWEFACRAGTTSPFSTGNDEAGLPAAAWINVNANNETHPVGKLAANPLGLFDMHGNVSEWCHDFWSADYYARFEKQAAENPAGPPAPAPVADAKHVVRGGNWNQGALLARSGRRDRCGPISHVVGFRIALDVDGARAASTK